jgi:tetratricopeptide (TPR) repeat protein
MPGAAVTAVERFPDEADPLLRRARARLQLGEIGEAIADYRRSLAVSSTEARFVQLGKELWEDGAKPAAVEIWEAGAQRFPASLPLHRNLGFARYEAGDYPGAVTHYRRAAEVAPEDLAAKTDLAWALLRLGSLDEARAICHQVLAREPTNQAALGVLSHVAMVTTPVGPR